MFIQSNPQKVVRRSHTKSYLEFLKIFVNVTYTIQFTLEVDKLQIFC